MKRLPSPLWGGAGGGVPPPKPHPAFASLKASLPTRGREIEVIAPLLLSLGNGEKGDGFLRRVAHKRVLAFLGQH
jgi:hypothetical protein